MVIVTPHLVAPSVPGQRLASPLDNYIPTNDVDFFLMGEMEQKKKFRDYITSGGDIQGPYGHMIRSGFGFARDLSARDLGQELRHVIMKIRCIIGWATFAVSLACSGAWAWDQGSCWRNISNAKTLSSRVPATLGMCQRGTGIHPPLAALCRRPADSRQRAADDWGCRTLSREHAVAHALSAILPTYDIQTGGIRSDATRGCAPLGSKVGAVVGLLAASVGLLAASVGLLALDAEASSVSAALSISQLRSRCFGVRS